MISQNTRDMFDVFASIRRRNIELIDTVTPDKLTMIPERFGNNILWHAGHIVVVQASLLHLRLEMPSPVPKSWLPYFSKGSSPDDWDDNLPTATEVRQSLEDAVDNTGAALEQLCGKQYAEPITVSTGTIIGNFEAALSFLPVHEAYHLGAMTAMLKLIS